MIFVVLRDTQCSTGKLPALGQNRGLKGSLPLSGNPDLHLADTWRVSSHSIKAV